MSLTLCVYGQTDDAAGIDTTRAKVKLVEMIIKDTMAARHLDKGKKYFTQQEYKLAVDELNQAVKAGGSDSAYYYRGRAHMGLYDREESLADFDTLLARHPSNTSYYEYRAYVKKKLYDFEGGIADCNKALAIDSNYVDAWLQRGDIYYQQGKYKTALADYNKAISINPKYYYSYYLRASLYHATRDFDLAIINCDTTIMLNPTYERGWWDRGLYKVKSGDTAASCSDFNKAYELARDKPGLEAGDAASCLRDYCQSDPYTDPEILHAKPPPLPWESEEKLPPTNSAIEYHKRAVHASENFVYNMAIADETEAIRLDSTYKQAYFFRGFNKYITNQIREAMLDFSRVIELDPRDTQSYYYRGLIKNKLGNFQAALSDFDKVLEINPRFRGAYTGRGEAKFNMSQYETAIVDLSVAISLDSFDHRVLMLRGRARLALSQPDSACLDFRQGDEKGDQLATQLYYKYCRLRERGLTPPVAPIATKVAPRSAALDHLNRGRTLYNHSEYEAAVKELTNYLVTDTSFNAYYYRGLSQVNLAHWVEGINDLTRAVAIDSSQSNAYYMRGKAKLGIRMDPGACVDFRRAERMGMKAAKEMIDLFCKPDTIHSYSKEPEKEIAGLKKATEMDSGMAELYLEKAFAEVRAFDFQAAIADQTKAIQLNTNYKEAYFNRGLAKINTQDLEGGLLDLNKAIQLDSQYADAYFGRASVRMKQGAFKEALTDFNEAIAFNPGDGKSYMLRGMCRLGLNQKDEACADLHKADELKYFQAPQMIAKYCKSVPEPPKATKSASDIPSDSTSDARAWYARGVTQINAGDYSASIPFLDKALELDPKFVDAYYARGGVEKQFRRYRSCISYMDKALAIDPKSAKCHVLRGESRFHMLETDPGYSNASREVILNCKDSACNDMIIADFLDDPRAAPYLEEYCNGVKNNADSTKPLPATSEVNDIPRDSISSALAWFNHGMAKFNAHEYASAVPYIDKAIELDPKYVDAYFARGNLSMISEQFQMCIRDMNTALSIDSNDAKCYILRGIGRLAMVDKDHSYHHLSDEEKKALSDTACRDLHTAESMGDRRAKEIIEHYCLNAEGHFQLGLKLIKEKHEKKAIEEFDKAIEIDDHFAKAYAYRGYCEMHYSRRMSAKEDFIVALALNPKYAKTYYFRALLYADEKHDFKSALPDMDKAIELDSPDIEMYAFRAYVRDELKDYKGAISDLDQVIRLDAHYDKAYRFRGEEKSKMEDYRGAVDDYTMAIAEDSFAYEIFNNRGDAKKAMGDYEGAKGDYNKTLERDKRNYWAWYSLGGIEAKLQDYNAAISDYTSAISCYEGSHEAYYQRAKIYIMLGKYTEACADLKKATGSGKDVDELMAKYCK